MHDLHMAQLTQTWSMQEAGQDVTFGCKQTETQVENSYSLPKRSTNNA